MARSRCATVRRASVFFGFSFLWTAAINVLPQAYLLRVAPERKGLLLAGLLLIGTLSAWLGVELSRRRHARGLQLTPTSLQLWRGKRMLFEEPLPEAYAMTVLPARRMVAVYGTSFEHRPIVDVLYVRSLQRKVKAGQGCCSWVSLAVDGCDVQLASTDDRLYVHDGRDWIEIDDEPLTSVPSWIRNRGWVS